MTIDMDFLETISGFKTGKTYIKQYYLTENLLIEIINNYEEFLKELSRLYPNKSFLLKLYHDTFKRYDVVEMALSKFYEVASDFEEEVYKKYAKGEISDRIRRELLSLKSTFSQAIHKLWLKAFESAMDMERIIKKKG